MSRRKTRSSLAVMTVLGMLMALLPVTAASAASSLLINEVDADQVSTDSAEFVELFDGGDGNTDLTGLSIVLYNGSDNASYNAFDLDGQSTDGDGYFVLCGDAANVANCDLDVSPDTNLIQNGADAVALVEGDAVDFPNGTPVSTTGVVDAIVYDTDDSDDADLLVLLNAGQPQVNERGGGDGTGHSNQRCPNGSGGARNTDTYAQASPTPGAANDCPVIEPPADVDTAIYDIQFTADAGGDSPMVGIEVVTEGVATAVFDGLAFIQDGSGPFSGLAVFNPSVSPAVGDIVRVRGTVTEFFGLTQISNGTSWIMGTVALPAPEVLATAEVAQEQWESVFVRAEDAVVSNPSLGFGEWAINDGTGDVRVDDEGTYAYVPVSGDPIEYLQGPLDYTFGNFKIQPRNDGDISAGSAVCGADFTPIYNIQGNSWSSPLEGSQVWTEGVVTADFQGGSQLSAFYIQDPAGDGDPGTSDGVMVYHRDTWDYDVSVGDHVRLLAAVDEYRGLTQLGNVANLSVCGTGSIAPTTVTLPLGDVDREALEGMYVTIPQSLNIIEFFNFDRFGEYVLGNGRQFQPTQVFEPGSADAVALAAANEVNQLRVDDARGGQNPDPAIHPNGLEFTLDNRFRGGDLVTNLTGVVDYAFGDYKIQPTQGADYEAINPRTEAPDVGGSVKVAAFNVLNFFTHLDDGDNDICGPLGINECRGADTEAEYIRQRDKIVAGIIGLDADVVGLMEIENDIRNDEPVYPNQAHDPVIKLVEALNAAEALAGSGYTWGWDVANYYNNYPVRNEILYRNTVTPHGPPVALQDVAFDGIRPYSRSPLDPVGRPPVAQTFVDPTGEVFTVVANHFKSKGSGCDDGVFDPVTGELLWLDPASPNGQANCPLTRVKQAEALMDWLATDPTGSNDADVLVIGDLNSYALEDPIDVIVGAGYANLLSHFGGLEAYTYVFDGQLGNLDHALGSPSIMSQVTGTAAWHINSDEPDILDYDMSFKRDAQDALYEPNEFRASDHDPVIVGLELGVQINVTPDTLWAPNHKYVDVEVSAETAAGNPLSVVITGVVSSEDDSGYGEGDMPDDVGNIDGSTVELRAERYTLEGRTYTIHVDLYDGGALVTSGTVDVVVPHDQRKVKPTTN